ncbi:hypothetical protein GCM10023196_047260 [Actinoallomurus vinaceus]|uniref:Uncharacterized protein n=1 Tax=Actinoallomurus vinaceus TaxID=1080074 RepID=A0ABP8UCF2_9ACTN
MLRGCRWPGSLNQAGPPRALPDPLDAEIRGLRRGRLCGLFHEYAQVVWGDTVFGPRKPTRDQMLLVSNC